jgi:hypothetical protein
MGPKHLGVFSGHPFQKEGGFANTGRVIFFLSGMIVMLFSILTVTKGLSELQTTVETVNATNADIIKIHSEFVAISVSLRRVARTATPVRDELVEFLNKEDICPLNPGSSVETDIRKIGDSTLIAMEDLVNFIEDKLELIVNKALDQVREVTRKVESATDSTNLTDGAAAGVMIPYFFVPALLMVALFMGWFEVHSEGYFCFVTWLLLPLYVLMIMFSYAMAGFAALATEGNADFCAGGADERPEGTINRIMMQYNLTQGNFYYDTVTFYASQCQTEGPWGFLEGYYGDLVSYRNVSRWALSNSIVREPNAHVPFPISLLPTALRQRYPGHIRFSCRRSHAQPAITRMWSRLRSDPSTAESASNLHNNSIGFCSKIHGFDEL